MLLALQLFPESAATNAPSVDRLFFFLLAISGFITLLILVLIMYFVLRYRRRGEERPQQVKANLKLEIAWTLIPLLIAIGIFIWGAKVYLDMFTPPADAQEIYVIGKQWMWKIQHPEGRREINELHIPVNQPIKLTLASQDVIHSFFIPAFRIKRDVLPGRYTSIWFEATRTGTFDFFCAEYCGTEHSQMTGKVHVMEPGDYQNWLAGTDADVPLARVGEQLYARFGCLDCHGQRGPTLAGLYNSEVRLAGGQTVIADNNYLRESILDSTAKIVAGWPPIMPSYRGQISEEQLIHLIDYIKSLAEPLEVSTEKP